MSASSNTLGTMWRGIQHVAFLAFCASVPAVGFGQPATLKKPDHTALAREVAAVRGAYKKEIAAANKD